MRFTALRRLSPFLGVMLVFAAVGTVSAAKPAKHPADLAATGLAATASVGPTVQYLNDTAGTVFTFSIRNTGTVGIGAVEVARPSSSWSVAACPSAPAGWSTQRSDNFCRYRSGAGSTDDLAPGTVTDTFQVRATTAPGIADRTGSWSIHVSSSKAFDEPSSLEPVPAEAPGLIITAFSFQITDVVVATGNTGDPCPAPTDANHSAITGSSQTILVCGRNRMSVSDTPTASRSSLAGTFIADDGTFHSASIPANSGVMVIGTWTGAEITSTSGAGKSIVATIGSAANRNSPITKFDDVCPASPAFQACRANGGYEALNQRPLAQADSFAVQEDGTLNVPKPGVLANDTDPDGDPLEAVEPSDPANGTVSLEPDGSFLYIPDADFNGSDSFTYRVEDPFGARSAPAEVTISVIPVNDDPDAVDDSVGVSEDAAPVNVDVLANDSDDDAGDALTVAAVDTTGTSGLVTNNGTDVTYDPNGQFDALEDGETDTDTFAYTVSDGHGGTDTATVTVTVTGVTTDVSPTAIADAVTVGEDSGANAIDVLANDTDPDGGPMTISSASDPTAWHRRVDGRRARCPHRPDLRAGPGLLQRPARHDDGRFHLHPQRRLHDDGVHDRHLRRRPADGRRRQRDGARRRDRDRDPGADE